MTLIEVMVVIVILGILAAIAIPAFANQRQVARDAVVRSDLANAAIAVEVYSAAHDGSYTGLTVAKLVAPPYEVKLSPATHLAVDTAGATDYVLLAYDVESGASRTWRLHSGSVTGPH